MGSNPLNFYLPHEVISLTKINLWKPEKCHTLTRLHAKLLDDLRSVTIHKYLHIKGKWYCTFLLWLFLMKEMCWDPFDFYHPQMSSFSHFYDTYRYKQMIWNCLYHYKNSEAKCTCIVLQIIFHLWLHRLCGINSKYTFMIVK